MSDRYIVNVEAVIVRDGRYLMVVRSDDESHAPGILSVPGGKVEQPGTTAFILEETVRREIREEVAVEVEDEMVYIESKSFVTDDGDPVIDIVFLCRYCSGEPVAMDSQEVVSLAWMTSDEVFAHSKTPPWTRQSIEVAEIRRANLCC